MNSTTLAPNNPFRAQPSHNQAPTRDDWEDWTDDEEGPTNDDGFLVDVSDESPPRPSTSRGPAYHRASLQRPLRVKSKGRQKAQNAKAGIKLITDMSKFGRPVRVQQMKSAGSSATPKGKFVDATALQALEGDPTSASIGSFSWLKRGKNGKKTFDDRSPNLSPDARPIMIGIQMPSDEAQEQRDSPMTATVETPVDPRMYQKKPATKNATPQQRSVWSPDTEASESPYSASVYSQPSMYASAAKTGNVPPVPALPATFKFKQNQNLTEADEDDLATPCTLFEEDGNSPARSRKSLRPKPTPVSPESASSRSHGWWDHVTTPFSTKSANPFKQQSHEDASATSPQGWWTQTNEKEVPTPATPGITIMNPAGVEQRYIAESSSSSSRPEASGHNEKQPENHSEKAKILLEENQTDSEQPPPYSYSPPKQANPVKFVAIPPPSQVAVLQQPVSSPGPMTPGLPGTMTSQGSINMTEIPADATGTSREGTLPDRPLAAYVVGDHFQDARGDNWKSERQRRRYEKEEAVARKAGGFWRGRGVFSENGCFGRTGREGRKRRRVYLGIFGGLIAFIILIVVLSVVLTQQASEHKKDSSQPNEGAAPGQSTAQPSPEPPSNFLNLTDFPPMPTGVLTVVGPENPESISTCMVDSPETAWSCSLPKEEHKPNEPFAANRPTFIFQIQYDTSDFWNITDDGEQVPAPGIKPNPEPPTADDMRFLGNSTDEIAAEDKNGEPTPFYISLLSSPDQTVGENLLERRQNNAIGGAPEEGESGDSVAELLPPPETNADGTPAPARLFPLPVQQPVRLFDRGLETEHYGFYTYFNKTVYLSDINSTQAGDRDGGAALSDARYVVTFAQTRFLVEMWTGNRTTTTSSSQPLVLLDDPNSSDSSSASAPLMPYPVTITSDLHGGDRETKAAYYFGVDADGQLNATDAAFVTADPGADGTLVNGKNSADLDLSRGGIDGGTGGCRCAWVNFRTSP